MLELALLANACLASRARAHVACRVQPLASPPPETFDPRAPPAAQGQWKGGPFERSCCTCPPCLGARAYIADSGAYIPTMRLSTASVASAGDLRAFCIDHDLASFRRRARDAPAGARGPIPSPWRGPSHSRDRGLVTAWRLAPPATVQVVGGDSNPPPTPPSLLVHILTCPVPVAWQVNLPLHLLQVLFSCCRCRGRRGRRRRHSRRSRRRYVAVADGVDMYSLTVQ